MLEMRRIPFMLIGALLATTAARAQQSSDTPAALTIHTAAPAAAREDTRTSVHPFWDRKNVCLFSGVGASRALDYASTLNLRHRGGHEVLLTDAVVDNHALFAGIEAAGTAISIGASYLFHRTGHHKIERWVSIIHIGVATGGSIRNYALKGAHPAPNLAP